MLKLADSSRSSSGEFGPNGPRAEDGSGKRSAVRSAYFQFFWVCVVRAMDDGIREVGWRWCKSVK